MRTSKPKITVRRNPGGSISYCVDSGVIETGKRRREFFSTRREARAHCRKMQAARKKRGALAFSLDTRAQIDATEAIELLNPYDVTLVEVARYYVKHAQPKGGRKLFSEVAKEFLGVKEKAGSKPRYVKELRCKLDNFEERFGERYVNEITRAEIEEWLASQNFSLLTQINYLRDLGIFFRWCVQSRLYCAENPINRIEKPKALPTETQVFTPHQALSVLWAAHISRDLNLVPYLSIGFFAGLRSSELAKLDWENINLLERTIEVTAESSKTSRDRYVHICDNLLAWLKPHEKMKGAVTPKDLYRRITKVLKLAMSSKDDEEIVSRDEEQVTQNGNPCPEADESSSPEWPRNGLRHSFGSYHFALHKNANLTASELGHESTKMLFKNYRKKLPQKEAEDYFNIYPPQGWAVFPVSLDRKRVSPQKPDKVRELRKQLQSLLAAYDDSNESTQASCKAHE